MASELPQEIYIYIYLFIYTHTFILLDLIPGNSVITGIESVSNDSNRSQEKKKGTSERNKQCRGKVFE